MTAAWMAALAATVGVLVGALATRRWSAKIIGQGITDVGGTGTLTVLAGIGGFVFLTVIIGLDYILNGKPPSEGWVVPYSFCAGFAGVGAAIKGVHRATTKPEVITAEAEAEAKKVLAVAKADVVRKTGAVPVVADEPLREDAP